MDLKKHLKINGSEAIKRLIEGETVFDSHGAKYAIDKEYGTLWYASPFSRTELDRTFNQVLKSDWYIPQPLNIRKVMLERPNTWVGAYSVDGHWYKVGFDSNYMLAVETDLYSTSEVDYRNMDVITATVDIMDQCIPIEEAPKQT